MKKNRRMYVGVINTFIILTVIALVATVYLTLARAEITVTGEREKFTNTAPLEVRPTTTPGMITGTFLSREYTQSDTFNVGAKTLKTTKAGGIVTIINNYSRSQALVKTTRLLSADSKLFRLNESITVPAGARREVFIEADKAGDEFLIGPGTFTIPGLWEGIQDKIYAESKTPMSYDRSESATITQDDVTKAQTSLTNKILDLALADFQKQVTGAAPLTRDMLKPRVISVTSDPAVGKQGSTVKVTVQAAVAGVAIPATELLELTKATLISQLAHKESFIELIPDSLTYTIASVDMDKKTAQIQTEVSAWVNSQQKAPSFEVKKLQGLSVSEAKAYLTSQGLGNATIHVFPSWIPRLPYLEEHITVMVR